MDRLSELPDANLSEILSLLPLESAIATSILSRRWRYLWTELPSLTIYNHQITPTGKCYRFWTNFNTISSKLTSPVYRSLILDLHHSLYGEHPPCPTFSDSLFTRICGSSIEIIRVISKYYLGGYHFVAPSTYVFQMKSLKVLELGGLFAWTLPSDKSIVHLPNLKKLSIHVICYQFKLLGKLISSIPSLEDLSFTVNCALDHHRYDCDITTNNGQDPVVVDYISLVCPNLKRLHANVDSNFSKASNKVIIDAPTLQYASYSSSGSNTSDRTVFDIFKAASNVRNLVVTGITIDTKLDGLTFPNLTSLDLRVRSSKDMEQLMFILKGCSVLEVLKLDLEAYSNIDSRKIERTLIFTRRSD